MGRKTKQVEEMEELIADFKECIGELMGEVVELKRQLREKEKVV